MDGGGSGGPAPFLLKTYDMVDDSATDEIVSWTSSKNSFVVWNPPEFARLLLPTYFKHNNFSSFIRQLNTYGFRKIDPEKWEFANEEFVKDQKHLLKNIHRRKPIHSHSHPQGSLVDPERAAFEEEIERLSRENAILEANLLKLKHHQAEKLQLENIAKKVEGMEKRQENLLIFLKKAVQNPSFVEQLARKVESMDFSSYNKKRRLPEVDHIQPVIKNIFMDNYSSSRSELGNMFQQDFSNKLRLELSPAVSDVNLVSCSTQSSNDDGGSPQRRMSEEEYRSAPARAESLYLTTETLDLSDTGTSFTLNMDLSSQRNASRKGRNPKLYTLQESGTSIEDGDSNISCHLNLTLASSPLQFNISSISARIPQLSYENGKSPESVLNSSGKEYANISCKNGNIVAEEKTNSPCQDPHRDSPETPPAPVRVNDVFWEQFLTERPGCAENEEASSNNKLNPYNELDSGRSGHGIYRNTKNIDELSL